MFTRFEKSGASGPGGESDSGRSVDVMKIMLVLPGFFQQRASALCGLGGHCSV